MEAETRFPAMGSRVHVIIVGGSLRLLDTARAFLDKLEGLWSRFRATSEISRLTAMAGEPVRVAPETIGLIERAMEGARITGGQYDPSVLGAVLRAGYDRSFELMATEGSKNQSSLGLGANGIRIDRTRSTVTLPPLVGFDPGGIGKGYAADLLMDLLLGEGAAGVCANIGGDLRVGGDPPGDSWVVEIEHPGDRRAAATVALRSGAIATSSRMRRAWGVPQDRRHHLIDPRTGKPADTVVASSTAIAAEGWQAEVIAKAAFVAGPSEGLRIMSSTGTDGLLIEERGAIHRTPGFDRFCLNSPPTQLRHHVDGKDEPR
jgi:thiamine biosynthesis lipoprotein